jgi:hypothetical protein
MRFIKTIAAPLLGLLIVITGFVYDVLFAGIPYQDPTPAMQARYDFHSAVAGWIQASGGILFLVALIGVPFILKKTKNYE